MSKTNCKIWNYLYTLLYTIKTRNKKIPSSLIVRVTIALTNVNLKLKGLYSQSPHNGRPVWETAKSLFHTPDDTYRTTHTLDNSHTGHVAKLAGLIYKTIFL